MPLSEHVYCVAVTFKMTERVEQGICIQFCVKLEHCSMETIWMIQSLQLWAAGDWQLHQDKAPAHHVWGRLFAETSNHPGDSVPLQPRFDAL